MVKLNLSKKKLSSSKYIANTLKVGWLQSIDCRCVVDGRAGASLLHLRQPI
jgi:hypothetical protein